jgi:ribosomal protein S18 acetylase RimI-like enzyme
VREYRGQGLFSVGLDVMREICREGSMSAIYLTVNRNNHHACEVYRHKGFEIIAEEDNDIGCGFEMNDYIMQLEVE